MNNTIIETIKTKINLETKYIKNIIELLEDGSTIAFIARYRKDITGNASDETLLKFQEVYEYSQKLLKRKEEIINILKEKDNLNDKLIKLIDAADTLRILEDIYEPFKGTKNTRADDAVKNGLTDLANVINPFSIMTKGDTLNLGMLIFKVIITYLIYQFVVSVRQNTRRK